MAKAVKPLNTRGWPREGLTLEPAIERAVGALKPLYEARAALEDIRDRVDYVRPEFEAALERERQATIEQFRQFIINGELKIAVRSMFDPGAPHHPLHSDEAGELQIVAGKNSLALYLGGKRLHALVLPKDLAPRPNDLRAQGAESPSPSPAEAIAATSAKPVDKSDAGKVAMKKLLEDAIVEIPFPAPEDRLPGWKKAWAAEAAHAINKRHEQNPKKINRTIPGSVQNRTRDLELWPE
jgi:hypothetical protein